MDTALFEKFNIKAIVSLIEFTKFDKIVSMGDDLLDLEYKILDQENLINLFEMQKNKWDFLEFKEVVQGSKKLCCYAIPNIIFKTDKLPNYNRFTEVDISFINIIIKKEYNYSVSHEEVLSSLCLVLLFLYNF